VEPTLAVIGLNFRTSPVAVRERFWISPARRRETLLHLVRSEGIEEVIALATCNRTEFILWASDVPTAANSVLRFLAQEYQLKLGEWSHFYRLMDDVALSHVFRVISSLDSMVLGEPEITGQVKEAWALAQEIGTTGRFLDAVMQKALTVSKRTRSETAIGSSAVSIPYASVELSRAVLGNLTGREVLLIGAGKMSELAAHYLMKAGARNVKVMNRTPSHGAELAQKLGATALLPVQFSAATRRRESRATESADPWSSSTSQCRATSIQPFGKLRVFSSSTWTTWSRLFSAMRLGGRRPRNKQKRL
jgi:glutamyl-tRNA reductase